MRWLRRVLLGNGRQASFNRERDVPARSPPALAQLRQGLPQKILRVNETHAAGWRGRRLTDILRRMRYDGCGEPAVIRRSSPY